ncbi:hypothetical protein BC351_17880 [Paenibacillus ferrarius]|uniref:DUF2515 domain-containing protein n=1 Tax=Paenibacillus ferrarius TaxID=1469647 RepID=A0A1V4HQ32_9BACL|nr:DUF2515 family protein [Paenibacillus ferrarius]OPH60367.1 hypothetical protein BC351_17880 [Paenibacillus ferrarius]
MGRTTKPRKDHEFWEKLKSFPSLIHHFFDTTETPDHSSPIPVSEASIKRIEARLIKQRELLQAGVANQKASAEELELVKHIREQTAQDNRNNVTRTTAYWRVYIDTPAIHWALLAHMVSRNGGWCMTDLRGELLPRLLNQELTDQLFAFLERANGLIFHDAYPQLLLYQESMRRKISLFHLLPDLGVSAWMLPFWKDFWEHRDSAILTLSLIVNEQNFIEQRIVQNTLYQESVLNNVLFKSQAYLQLNQVGFPFKPLPTDAQHAPDWHLAGLILEHFADQSERIAFGKSLYAILFGIPEVLESVIAFAAAAPHTGSRADYWPNRYSPIAKASPDTKYQERLDGAKWMTGASPLYSPPLAQAWSDRPLAPVEPGDWFTEVEKPLSHLNAIPVPEPYDMTNEIYFGLNKIELAIRAAEML